MKFSELSIPLSQSEVNGVFYNEIYAEDLDRILENPKLLEGFLCDADGNPLTHELSADQRELLIAELGKYNEPNSIFERALKDIDRVGVSRMQERDAQKAQMLNSLTQPIAPSPLVPMVVSIEQHLQDSKTTSRWALIAGACAALFSFLTWLGLSPEIGHLLIGQPDPTATLERTHAGDG